MTSVWLSSTGLDWSIRVDQRVQVLAGVDRQVESYPSPAGTVPGRARRPRRSDSSTTVFRLSRGIAVRPRLVAPSSELMSGGTEVRSDGYHVAVFQRRPFCAARQQLDVLLADRRHAVHLGVRDRRGCGHRTPADSTASTPVSVRRTACTRPTSVPR